MHINAYAPSSETNFGNKGKNKRCIRRQNTAYLAKNIHFLCSLADGRVYTKKRQESQPTGADHSPPASQQIADPAAIF